MNENAHPMQPQLLPPSRGGLPSSTGALSVLPILLRHLLFENLDHSVRVVVLFLDLSLESREVGAEGEDLGVVERFGGLC